MGARLLEVLERSRWSSEGVLSGGRSRRCGLARVLVRVNGHDSRFSGRPTEEQLGFYATQAMDSVD